ncbi:MAG: hypothetical protein ACLRQF_00900 [Thomasclavelia ramosa]
MNDPSRYYQALHHIFVVSAKAVILGHKIDSNNQIGMMLANIHIYETCNPRDVALELDVSRKLKYFYSDVHVEDIILLIL